MSKRTYTVLSRVDHDRTYVPGNAIELTKEEARPLLADGVVCEPDDPRAARAGEDADESALPDSLEDALAVLRGAPPDQVQAFLDRMAGDEAIRAKVGRAGGARPEQSATSRAAAIADAIKGLDRADESKWTKSGKPTTEALEAVLGFSVTASERDAAHAAMEDS